MSTTHTRSSLTALEAADDFQARHIGPDADATRHMLDAVGAPSLDALIRQTVPASILLDAPLDLPGPVVDAEVVTRLADIASENVAMQSLRS